MYVEVAILIIAEVRIVAVSRGDEWGLGCNRFSVSMTGGSRDVHCIITP